MVTAAQTPASFERLERIYQSYFNSAGQTKILCVGQNYAAHNAEMQRKEPPTEPVLFTKPTSSVILSGGTLTIQPNMADVHHEAELGVVIGMNGRNIRKADALKHVAGYFVGVDFTDRAFQAQCKQTGADWCVAKAAPGFAAVSDYIAKAAVPDSSNVDLELRVNGETRQSTNTSDFIFDVATVIEDASKYFELREGDIIFTGTPSGVAAVVAGDTLECSIKNGGEADPLVSLKITVA